MSILIIGLLAAFGISLLYLALQLKSEQGALAERLRKAEEQAAIDKARAEIIAQPRTDDETINRLDSGTF